MDSGALQTQPLCHRCWLWETVETCNPFKLCASGNGHRLSRALWSCFSAEGHLLCFSNWQIERSEKDWISLKFTAARFQWALCVCLYYYLSGWKRPSVLTCPRKEERNNGVFNFIFFFKSAQLWFSCVRVGILFGDFWHCLINIALRVLMLR